MMENNNDWFENLNYSAANSIFPQTFSSSILNLSSFISTIPHTIMKDHQQQTFVTKHDLELLHKKIIATDLIVQKYQEANKALLRLQVENDDLKQQIEQITNECCIFSKQVTECTQECDNLKEQVEILNSDKRELHQQIRLLHDENTNNHHEIMVLRQYESLKETNDQLTKTVERQQKTIGKLQLQAQRASPVVYKSLKNKRETSETDIALTKSEKSVRELKLALGRLVNFIQISKIEIPTGLYIRPVLKAHDITDDFLEVEGDIPRKPVKKVSKPVVSQTDDDDDDNQADFIDVNHSIPVPPQPPPPVHTTDVIEKAPLPSRQEKKKSKPPKKSRRRKDTATKLDELANELEIALSQPNQPTSLPSDDDNLHKSDKPKSPEINSTITIGKDISFFSEDENEISTPSAIIEYTMNSLQVDAIIPMEVETSNQRTPYMSFLSEGEDDDENNRPMSTQEYISPLKLDKPTFQEDIRPPRVTYQPSSIVLRPIAPIPENIRLSTEDQITTTTPPISVNTLDPNRIQIVLRLLNTLTHVPVPLKPLRLVRRRIQQKPIPEETKTQIDSSVMEILEQPESMDESHTVLESQVSIPMEEQPKLPEEIHDIQESNTLNDQLPERSQSSVEEVCQVQENNRIVSQSHEVPQTSAEESAPNEQLTIIKEPPVISIPQEPLSNVKAVQPKPTLPFKRSLPSVVLESPQKSSLKPSHVKTLNRLLTTITKLPFTPLVLPMLFPSHKKKRKSVVKKPSVPPPLARQPSTRLSRSPPPRMQTRSLSSIRARIARCNQPAPTKIKRTATESVSPSPSSSKKRMKSSTIEQKPISPSPTPSNRRTKSTTIERNINEYDLINHFLNSSSLTINDQLKELLRRKSQEDISSFVDHVYRILSEFMKKIELAQDKKHRPYEESLPILLTYIGEQSPRFPEYFIGQLNHLFEHEVQPQKLDNLQIQISDRLFIVICSTFASSLSPVIIYTRLFDIGYSLSHDILVDAMSYISRKYPSLIEMNNSRNLSNALLRRVLIDLADIEQFNFSNEYLEIHFRHYLNQKCDDQDLIRSLVVLFRHRPWSWCSNDLCSKILFPLLEQIIDRRLIFLTILQTSLFLYKDDVRFQSDTNFHQQFKQRLEGLENMNHDECTVRHNIVSILDRYLLNK